MAGKVVNFGLAVFWMWLFQVLHWIDMGTQIPLWQVMLIIASLSTILDLTFDVLIEIIDEVADITAFVTVFVSIFIKGWGLLVGVAGLAGWFTMAQPGWLMTMLTCGLFGFVRYHPMYAPQPD